MPIVPGRVFFGLEIEVVVIVGEWLEVGLRALKLAAGKINDTNLVLAHSDSKYT